MKNLSYARLKQDWVPLFVAMAVTILYVVFATPIYDILYHGNAEFSDMMFEQNLYVSVALITSAIVWVGAILYYWILDRYSSWLIWILFFAVVLVGSSVGAFYFPDMKFAEYDFTQDLQMFALVNIAVAFVLFFAVSLGVKNLSKNCATTPF